jgi:hypothetical protein
MPQPHPPRFWQRNSLSIVLAVLFLAFLLAQLLAGNAALNEERALHQLAPLGFLSYLGTGHAISATFENWESEFLQMGAYVLLTVKLRQWGSAESRPLDPARRPAGSTPRPGTRT